MTLLTGPVCYKINRPAFIMNQKYHTTQRMRPELPRTVSLWLHG